MIRGKVTGTQAIKATLAAMPQIVRDRLGEAIQTTASEITRVAKGNVPVRTGTLRDHIDFSYSPTYCRAKVGITPGTVVIQGAQTQTFKKVTRSFAATYKALGWKVYRASHYAHLVEFGHGQVAAHPFLGPAFTGEQRYLDARMQAAQRGSITDLANVGARYL